MKEIDRQIDDIARGMTAGDPDPALRARVVTRLDETAPRRWVWTLAPIAAAALIAIAIYLAPWKSTVTSRRPPVEVAGSESSDVIVPPVAPSITEAPVAAQAEPAVLRPETPGRRPVPRSGAPASSPELTAFAGSDIEVPGIEMQTLSVAPLETNELLNDQAGDINSLDVIVPIAVTPLSN